MIKLFFYLFVSPILLGLALILKVLGVNIRNKVFLKKLYLSLLVLGGFHVLYGNRLTPTYIYLCEKARLGAPIYFGAFITNMLLC